MAPRCLLYLTATHMSAHRWCSGHLDNEDVFSNTPSGHQAFGDYLETHRRDTCLLLVNLAEESFLIETIPCLPRKDRQALLQRKLKQKFFNAPLSASLGLGLHKTTRKNERVLLTALTPHACFEPWLKALASAPIALAGITSLPFLAPRLLGHLRHAEGQSLILTQQDQSVRQSYLDNGQVHFSRLTALPHSHDNELIARTIATEAIKLQRYLSSQRILAQDQAITAYLVASAGVIEKTRQLCTNTDALRFVHLDFAASARLAKLELPTPDAPGEALFLSLAAKNPSRPQFADDHLRHRYYLKTLQHWLYSLGGAIFFGGLLVTGMLLAHTHAIRQNADDVLQDAARMGQQHEEIARTFPTLPTRAETLHQIADHYVALQQQSFSPTGLYLEISRALQASSTIELDSIEWSAPINDQEDRHEQFPGTQKARRTVLPKFESAVIRGTIHAEPDASPRQILAVFTQFLVALKNNPELQVSVKNGPFDIEPGKSLRNDDLNVGKHPSRPFSIQILREVES